MTEKPDLTPELFLQLADHTLLASDTTAAQLDAFIAEAEQMGVKRVCVLPSLLPVEKRGREIVTVVGFPSGAHKTAAKVAETQQAVADGADEIDMVVNLGLVRAGEWDAVEADIRAVREACPGLVLKVILESATLSDDEIVEASRVSEAAGANFVKTSTGFHATGGASAHAVRLMAETVGSRLGVKASGGIRDAEAVREMWAAGATRFGVSATAAILASWSDGSAGEAAVAVGAASSRTGGTDGAGAATSAPTDGNAGY